MQHKKNPNRIGGLWEKSAPNDKGGTDYWLQGTIDLPSGGKLGLKVYKNSKKNSDKSPDFSVYKRKLKGEYQQDQGGGHTGGFNEPDVPDSWV